MQRFTQLYLALDRSNRTSDKLEAMRAYFRTAPPEDAIWAVYLLAGRKLGRTITSRQMRDWASEVSGFAPWMLNECYSVVGDLSETLSLLIPFPNPAHPAPPLHEIVEQRLKIIGKLPPAQQREMLIQTWRDLTVDQRFILHKLISTNFRVGVSKQSLTIALAEVAGVETSVMAHRLSGQWSPQTMTMHRLLAPMSENEPRDANLPFPFMLAHALSDPPESLGDFSDWQHEWKWDGIRAQIIRRQNKTAIWSRGDELISSGFPELLQTGNALPDGTVLDGEIVAWNESTSRPQPFAVLQRRINRKNVEPSFWPDVPVMFIAFDLLELDARDIRNDPLSLRRAALENLIAKLSQDRNIAISQPVDANSWEQLIGRMTESRDRAVEGVMLKRRDSLYHAGRPTGPWWKLKVQPYTMDAVLISAQPGTGKRAGLLTDYTFGVWDETKSSLVPVAKAYSGLTDAEIAEMDRFIRSHTTGRFGPVHAVEPLRVFELGFEAIQRSDRHKSGLAVRFPRILRLRDDKKPADADSIQTLRNLLATTNART
ncbi:MAG TPA: ATP-dependent DNA ligase [Tepidisphaeraceae bacterium]|jgi:DNA ligase-1|nr:ATP-dependent DNA ligase [Tepidisphaeraceae bacterium]